MVVAAVEAGVETLHMLNPAQGKNRVLEQESKSNQLAYTAFVRAWPDISAAHGRAEAWSDARPAWHHCCPLQYRLR